MKRALDLAVDNVRTGLGGPFGAVVAIDGQIVGEGANRVTSSNDPTAHAEILAIRTACSNLQRFELRDCEIYTSCEPCPMCLGAILWARLKRIYFSATQKDAAAAGFDDTAFYAEIASPPGARSIPMLPLLHDQARWAFDEWKRKADKVRY
jgi:tRNA(Arg) A34 adenosine deaminase TadA